MAAANPGAHRADGRKCSGKALLFAKILPQAAGNKKITVADMVSTTVTDLVRVAIQNFSKSAVISTVSGFRTTKFLACNFIFSHQIQGDC